MNVDQNPAASPPSAPTNGASFASLTSSRASPFPSTTVAAAAAARNAMAAQSFLPPAQQPIRPTVNSQSSYPLSIAPPVNSFDRDATKPVGTPFSAAPTAAPLSSAVIHGLAPTSSEDSLKLMLLFSKDLVDVEFLPAESDDPATLSALVKFRTPAGALEVKNNLDGRPAPSGAGKIVVEILGSSPSAVGKRYPIDTSVSGGASTATSSAASSATSSRQTSRFNGTFQSLDKIAPPMNGVYGAADLTSPEPSTHYHSIFSPQSPIGNHLTDRNRVSGKSLIKSDSPDDDETGELLKDPVGFAENGPPRRQTAPQIPLSRMATLSLNTTPASGHAPIPHYAHPAMAAALSAHPNTMSPTAMGGGLSGPAMGYGQQQPYRTHNFPPANPADQNPPCNTLYVGNLPIDTSEEELKAMFSKQRGYKRLCFRTKQNGPMCFVEFEDISFATKALTELYGHPLHNSVKGGIRLSFSKNPLGVRSGQSSGQGANGAMGNGASGMHQGSSNGFTTANGPPPGLSAPPGLGMNRSGHSPSPNLSAGGSNSYSSPSFPASSNNPWGQMYNNHPSMMAGSANNFPSHMMGR